MLEQKTDSEMRLLHFFISITDDIPVDLLIPNKFQPKNY